MQHNLLAPRTFLWAIIKFSICLYYIDLRALWSLLGLYGFPIALGWYYSAPCFMVFSNMLIAVTLFSHLIYLSLYGGTQCYNLFIVGLMYWTAFDCTNIHVFMFKPCIFVMQVSFYLYSPESQITDLPQAGLQSVQHRVSLEVEMFTAHGTPHKPEKDILS